MSPSSVRSCVGASGDPRRAQLSHPVSGRGPLAAGAPDLRSSVSFIMSCRWARAGPGYAHRPSPHTGTTSTPLETHIGRRPTLSGRQLAEPEDAPPSSSFFGLPAGPLRRTPNPALSGVRALSLTHTAHDSTARGSTGSRARARWKCAFYMLRKARPLGSRKACCCFAIKRASCCATAAFGARTAICALGGARICLVAAPCCCCCCCCAAMNSSTIAR